MRRLVAMLALLTAETAAAASLEAGDDLGAAVASASPGEIILLGAGVFDACLVLDQDVTIIGLGSGQTTIECAGSDYAIEIDQATARLAGIAVVNSGGGGLRATGAVLNATDLRLADLSAAAGAAIHLTDTAATLTRLDVHDNIAANGGGLYATDSSIELYGGSFSGNAATTGDGGAISLNRSDLGVHGTGLWGNSAAADGGAIYATLDSGTYEIELLGASFSANTAGVTGGGVALDAPVTGPTLTLDVVGTLFDGNQADHGGAIGTSSAPVELFEASFLGNVATADGGAVRTQSTTLTSRRCTFEGNSGATGGAIFARSYDGAGDFFSENLASGSGGAMFVDQGEFVAVDNLYVGNSGSAGGALYLDDTSAADETRSTYDGNQATSGGAVFVDSASGLLVSGATFTGNTAQNGGAVYAGSTGELYIQSSDFTLNEVTTVGGAVFVGPTAQLSVAGALFRNNSADYGGAVGYVGSTPTSSSRLEITLSEFTENAAYYGAAIHDEFGLLDLTYSWLAHNVGTYTGAVYTFGAQEHAVHANLFCENRANNGDGGALTIDSPWGERLFRNNGFVANYAAGLGSAVYERDYYTSAPYSYTRWYHSTFAGNESATSDGAAVMVADYLNHANWSYVYDSVFESNSGGYDVSSTPGAASVGYALHIYVGSAFFASTKGAVGYDDYAYVESGVYKNTITHDPNVSWSNDGNCTNDSLISSAQNNGYLDADVGVESSYSLGGVQFAVGSDYDGDGFTELQGDCNDSSASIKPTATEIHGNAIDENCVMGAEYDKDGDTWVSSAVGGEDCNDSDASVKPFATANASDCDGTDDSDADRDGYTATSAGGPDCNDFDWAIHPGAVDVPYDEIDQNCSGADDDVDGDGVAAVADGGPDCDDSNASVHPDAPDTWYDGENTDCSPGSDFDADLDGQDLGLDCDDANSSIYQGAPEVWYDGTDQACDGGSDYDQDGDGHDALGEIAGGDDCNDTDGAIHSGAPEVAANGADDDCDGDIDEVDFTTDSDGDQIPDYYETLAQSLPYDPDSDGDGLADGIEWGDDLEAPRNSDTDSVPDVLDTDSDEDGLLDSSERGGSTMPVDSDGDGRPDYRDDDDDDDGVPTALEDATADPDGDGLVNHLDPDSDGDGSIDGSEDTGDQDGDGVPDYLDDGSGSSAPLEPAAPEQFGFGLGCASVPSAPQKSALLALVALFARRRRAQPAAR